MRIELVKPVVSSPSINFQSFKSTAEVPELYNSTHSREVKEPGSLARTSLITTVALAGDKIVKIKMRTKRRINFISFTSSLPIVILDFAHLVFHHLNSFWKHIEPEEKDFDLVLIFPLHKN